MSSVSCPRALRGAGLAIERGDAACWHSGYHFSRALAHHRRPPAQPIASPRTSLLPSARLRRADMLASPRLPRSVRSTAGRPRKQARRFRLIASYHFSRKRPLPLNFISRPPLFPMRPLLCRRLPPPLSLGRRCRRRLHAPEILGAEAAPPTMPRLCPAPKRALPFTVVGPIRGRGPRGRGSYDSPTALMSMALQHSITAESRRRSASSRLARFVGILAHAADDTPPTPQSPRCR